MKPITRPVNDFKQLCQQCEANLDAEIAKLQQETREREDLVTESGLNLKCDIEKLESLKIKIDPLRIREEALGSEVRKANDELDELSLRLNLLNNELLEDKRSLEENTGVLENLKIEVVEMEHDKENRICKMREDFRRKMKFWKVYKGYLNMKMVYKRPDRFDIGFTSSKDAHTPLTLRSFPDLKDWEITHADGKPEFINDLTAYFMKTNDLLGVMCRARKYYS